MQKIIPHLWFNTQAKEAAEFYTSIFPNSEITFSTVLRDTPSGDCDMVSFDLNGFSFMAISAGPLFSFTPAISFMVNFDPSRDTNAEKNLETLWGHLSDGGSPLMALQEYPFSKKYGWIQDKFGVSWQLILTDPDGEERPFIIPSLLFGGEVAGKAEEAAKFYVSNFTNAEMGMLVRYGEGQAPNKPEYVMFSDFQLEDQWFTAMDSGLPHNFVFNEAISLLISCENQAEIDAYWQKLSAVPEAEQCGWLKDRFGVSWQVSPASLQEMMEQGTPAQVARVTQAFLQMKKFNLAELEEAYKNE